MLQRSRRLLLFVPNLVLIAIAIWFMGPYFAFADYRPLESIAARLIVIAAMFTGAGISFLLSPQIPQQRLGTRLAGVRNKPWFVMIGAPGAGKTTLLINSGLEFPRERRRGKARQRGIAGTRNCDWWVSGAGVFVETAGRFAEHSKAELDGSGWSNLLALLRTQRKRGIVDGILMMKSAQEVMLEDDAARTEYVRAANRRIRELRKATGNRVPVYLVVTKSDLVAGFSECFADFRDEQRQRPWKVEFPISEVLAGTAPRIFGSAFDSSILGLNEQLFARFSEGRDREPSAHALTFPQQLAALRAPLTRLVHELFDPQHYESPVRLVAVYFTSGTQEGTTVDNLLGPRELTGTDSQHDVQSPLSKKAYFVKGMFSDILHAAPAVSDFNRRQRLRRGVAYVTLALITTGALSLMWTSYRSNRAFITSVANDTRQLQELPPSLPDTFLGRTLPRLDAIRSVSESANRFREGVPWSMRWGLYQGAALGGAARDAYSRELNGLLMRTLLARFEARLIEYASEPEKLYEYLKGYLMLGSPERLDKNQVAFLAEREWEVLYPSDTEAVERLSSHFRTLLESQSGLRPLHLDLQLVAQARSTIQQASIPQIAYTQLKLSYASDTSRALRLDTAVVIGAERVFRRRSGRPLSEPIPAIYTKPVFEEIINRTSSDLVRAVGADQWVWGEQSPQLTLSTRLREDLIDVYEKDYLSTWDGLLGDLDLVQLGSLDQTKDVLAILAGPASPLRSLLQVISEQTSLVTQAAAPSRLAEPLDALEGIARQGRKPTFIPGGSVQAHFAPVHRLFVGEQGRAPIDELLYRLRELHDKMLGVRSTGSGGTNSSINAVAVTESAGLLERYAALMPSVVGNLVTRLTARVRVLMSPDLAQ